MAEPILRRYANLASAIHLLKNKCLTLVDPAKWEDRGDAHFLAEYKRQMNAKSVLALCFSYSEETFHHWKVFAPGGDGVCIEFDRETLVSSLRSNDTLLCKNVEYLEIKSWDQRSPVTADLPFIKRLPYAPEKEYRVVHTDLLNERDTLNVPIDLSVISRITISPWIPKPLADSVKVALKDLVTQPLKVYQSTLLGNETWMKHATKAHR